MQNQISRKTKKIKDCFGNKSAFQISKKRRAGLYFRCFGCTKPITKPGAILFSPPTRIIHNVPQDNDWCKKFHICVSCYEDIMESLQNTQALVRFVSRNK